MVNERDPEKKLKWLFSLFGELKVKEEADTIKCRISRRGFRTFK